MDPSHARRYAKVEIERIVGRLLADAHPAGLQIPVDIDRLAYRNDLVDDIVPIELLEDKFDVAAALLSKPNGRFDILVDEETFDYQRARASFSIAHELGHIVLHSGLWSNCKSVQDSLDLLQRLKIRYSDIERNANFFAGAILIPLSTLSEKAADSYKGLVREYGFDLILIQAKLRSLLASGYAVSPQTMQIRLKESGLQRQIRAALRSSSPFLEPQIYF